MSDFLIVEEKKKAELIAVWAFDWNSNIVSRKLSSFLGEEVIGVML
jgi:hypothetical protein